MDSSRYSKIKNIVIGKRTDRELMEHILVKIESIELDVKKLKENLVDTHELMNNISNRMINK